MTLSEAGWVTVQLPLPQRQPRLVIASLLACASKAFGDAGAMCGEKDHAHRAA